MNKGGRNTFSKSERLCSKKLIAEIFERGNTLYSSLFRVNWIPLSPGLQSPAQIALSVPKKSIRSAVSRNLIRRRMKEAYRKNKYILYDFLNASNIRLVFVLIFKGSTIIDYQRIEESVIEALEALNKNVKQKQANLVKQKQVKS